MRLSVVYTALIGLTDSIQAATGCIITINHRLSAVEDRLAALEAK
ncbi:hypothetical protein ACFXHA_40905 [Nocardia sp. NPDC059240]